jgi:starch phosphorylase
MVFPATDLSEQISTAGTEASGTGCMKAVMNGGPIIGTLDGANIEIRDEVGAANMFIFGHTAAQITAMKPRGEEYANEELRRVLATISKLGYDDLSRRVLGDDRYFHAADFPSYLATQRQAAQTWLHADEWTPISILNVARSGHFSADRTIAEYAEEIWGAKVGR